MKKYQVMIIAPMLVFCIFNNICFNKTAYAEENKSKTKTYKKLNTETLKYYLSYMSKKYNNTDFDLNIINLPRNYNGNDYKYLYDSVYLKYLKINEYEKTTDYIERIKYNRKLWEYKVFLIMLQMKYDGKGYPESPYMLNYDPEKKLLSLKTNSQRLVTRLKFRHDQFKDEYNYEYYLNIENRDIINPKSLDSMINFSFNMEQNIAKENYNDIRILLVCKLPSLDNVFNKINNNYQLKATYKIKEENDIKSPEILAKYFFEGWKTNDAVDSGIYIMQVDLLEVWIYNIKNGDIYYKKRYI